MMIVTEYRQLDWGSGSHATIGELRWCAIHFIWTQCLLLAMRSGNIVTELDPTPPMPSWHEKIKISYPPDLVSLEGSEVRIE
jgi:hypothetical protein